MNLKGPVIKRFIFPAALVAIAGCTTSDDPADGRFFSGVSGPASGSYQARADERQAGVDTEEARVAALGGQIDSLRDELTRLRGQIANQQSELRSAGVEIPASPGGANDADRRANPQRGIPDTRPDQHQQGRAVAQQQRVTSRRNARSL